ncbi:MAG: nucleotidyltransferase family protein [Candidatus Erginobacter occultus]|nr:nucleotidyltransferase family protein [Candidatus Erginobacter occultus]
MNPPERPVYAIVLAAGESRRCAPRNKLFLPWGSSLILETVVSRVLASRAAGTAVVTGHQADRVADLLEKFPCPTVFNPDYRSGMGSSLVAGLDYWQSRNGLPPEAGFLIVLGDQPAISTKVIDRVIEAYRDSRAEIVVPVFRGRRGHPPVFHRRLAGEIREVAGRWGARELLRRHPEKILPVKVEAEEILSDIDTLDDWGRTYASS